MDFRGEEWEWTWMDGGKEKQFGRVFHKKVRARRLSDNLVRMYKVGDTVVMKGENDDTWTAQIVELFEVTEDDEELREVLQIDLRKMNNSHGYELMRVTLRWFYNPSDMNMHTLRSSSCPNNIRNEIYFSDHVEKEGYNDITVIEGKAWLVPSKRQREEFLQNPPDDYLRDMDQVRIVRCFVNSLSPELAVRELDTGELSHLLKHPTADKDLFETSRQRMRGLIHSNGSIIRPPSKGTGSRQSKRKRSRTLREPIELDDDEFDPNEGIVASEKESKTEASAHHDVRSSTRDRTERRKKKVIDVDDGEVTLVPDTESTRMQSLQQANEEVLDLVASLNQGVIPAVGDVSGGGDDYDVMEVDDTVSRTAGKQAQSSKAAVATARHGKEVGTKASRKITEPGKSVEDREKRKRKQGQVPVKPEDDARLEAVAGISRKQLHRDSRSDTIPLGQDKAKRREAEKISGKGGSHGARETALDTNAVKRKLSADAASSQRQSKKVKLEKDIIPEAPAKTKESRMEDVKRKKGTKVASDPVAEKTRGEGDGDWLNKSRQMLEQLDSEFKSMPTRAQDLFRSHAETAFDLAVVKITERGLFGKVDPKNEQLEAITQEILNELKHTTEQQANDPVDVGLEIQGDGDIIMQSVG